jgi:protein arginine N-methyltransferase 3
MSSIASDDSASAWASDFGAAPTKSLFTEETYENAQAALAADAKEGYDLAKEGSRLKLDLYGRMRLVNLIRRDVRL